MEPLEVTGRVGSGGREVGDSQGFDGGGRVTGGGGGRGGWARRLGRKLQERRGSRLVRIQGDEDCARFAASLKLLVRFPQVNSVKLRTRGH